MAIGTIRCHRIDLTRDMTKKHDLYKECYKNLLSDVKEDLNKWSVTSYLWVGRVYNAKMADS